MIMFLMICEIVALILLVVMLLTDLFGEKVLFSKEAQRKYIAKKLENEKIAFAAKQAKKDEETKAADALTKDTSLDKIQEPTQTQANLTASKDPTSELDKKKLEQMEISVAEHKKP
jgi:hypothetical protein